MKSIQPVKLYQKFIGQFGLIGETVSWIFLFDIILGLAHVIWPEYDWGDGRVSYFYFGNSRTLASWVSSMKFILIGILFVLAFNKDKERFQKNGIAFRFIWFLGGFIFAVLSFLEMSRFHHRIGLVDTSSGEPIQIVILTVIQLSLLGFFVFFFKQVSPDDTHFILIKIWAALWVLSIMLNQLNVFIPKYLHILTWLLIGWGYLFGGTILALYLGNYIFGTTNSRNIAV